MIDIFPFVSEVLSETGAQVELAESDICAKLPFIALTEVSNNSVVVTDGAEQVAAITIQLDIYDDTPEKVRSLAGVVSSVMISRGFRRDDSRTMKEDELWRQMQEYSCYIDAHHRIYSGSDLI